MWERSDRTRTTGRRSRLFLLAVATVVNLLFILSSAAFAADKHLNILLLHSYHYGMKWVDDITDSFIDGIKRDFPEAEFHVEYMDTKRVLSAEHLKNLLTEYRYKLTRRKFDLVATADDAALRFALDHRQELFPDVPLVFCGVNNFDPSLLRGNPPVTGVLEKLDVAETVATALSLHPETKRIYVINDRSQSGQGLHKLLEQELRPFTRRARIIFLEDYTVDQLAQIVQDLPSNSIILRSAFFQDKTGRPLADEKISYAAIDSHAAVPVYSLWDFYLGLGIVGGKLISGAAQGEMAAELARRILHGEPPASIPVIDKSPNRYMFDYTELVRREIALSSLPPGSTVINRPKPFYTIHKVVFWSAAGLAGALSVSLAFLIVSINNRKKVETLLRESHRRLLDQQKTLGSLIRSDIFSGEDLELTIRTLTESAVQHLGVERVSVWRFSDDRRSIRCLDLFEKSTRQHSSGMELKASAYPAYFSAVKREEAIIADNARTDARTRGLSDGYLSPLGITSMLDVPIHLNGQVAGVLCTEHVGPPVTWTPEQRIFTTALANLVALAVDQQERRRAEESLRQAEKKFRQLFDSAGDAIAIYSLDGTILEVNQRLCSRLGYSREELLQMSVAQLNPDEQRQNIPERMHTLQEQGNIIFETEHLHRNGSRVPVEVNALMIEYEGASAAMGVIRDISDRKEVERIKDEMISAVSHELRTPLTAVIGYITFMLENRVDQAQMEDYLKTMYGATQRLNDLVDNFLDLQGMRASRIRFDLRPVSLEPLFREVELLFSKVSALHTLTVDIPPALPEVRADDDQLHKVLVNLLSNAFKYSPDGGEIRLSARLDGDNVLIEVSDPGVGIAPEHRELIFERFYRVDNSDRRRIGGTGLGLALVREIVSAHGGKVSIQSTPGVGTTFTVSLPVYR